MNDLIGLKCRLSITSLLAVGERTTAVIGDDNDIISQN